MAGSSLRLDIHYSQREVTETLHRLAAAGGDMEAAFRDIGEALLNSHQERFERQESPDGARWEPLSDRYQARKKKNRDKILILEGDLRDLLRYQTSPDGLVLGTDRIYGATHQFGDDSRNIPDRPFLGLSDDDRQTVLEILQDHLIRAIGR